MGLGDARPDGVEQPLREQLGRVVGGRRRVEVRQFAREHVEFAQHRAQSGHFRPPLTNEWIRG